MNIKFDRKSIVLMGSFEATTKAKLKDFYESDEQLLFIVLPGELYKAVGKNGINVKKLANKFKKRIKIVEFSPEVEQFITNYIYPLKATAIKVADKIVTIEGEDVKTKGLLIGRNASNLRRLESIVKRHFDIVEIKVV